MSRTALGALAVVITLGLAGNASAHHPPKMERCEAIMFTGTLERLEWRRPHVELYVRTDDGELNHLTWLAINQLELEGITRDTLAIGDRVEIQAGVRPNEVTERPMLLSYIHRGDGWGWAQTPQGC